MLIFFSYNTYYLPMYNRIIINYIKKHIVSKKKKDWINRILFLFTYFISLTCRYPNNNLLCIWNLNYCIKKIHIKWKVKYILNKIGKKRCLSSCLASYSELAVHYLDNCEHEGIVKRTTFQIGTRKNSEVHFEKKRDNHLHH